MGSSSNSRVSLVGGHKTTNLLKQAISTTRNSELPEKKCVISLNSVKLGCRFQGSQQHTSPGEHEQFIVSVQTN